MCHDVHLQDEHTEHSVNIPSHFYFLYYNRVVTNNINSTIKERLI